MEKEKLTDLVWGYDYYEDPRTIDTHITRLIKKLGEKSNFIQDKAYKYLGEDFIGQGNRYNHMN